MQTGMYFDDKKQPRLATERPEGSLLWVPPESLEGKTPGQIAYLAWVLAEKLRGGNSLNKFELCHYALEWDLRKMSDVDGCAFAYDSERGEWKYQSCDRFSAKTILAQVNDYDAVINESAKVIYDCLEKVSLSGVHPGIKSDYQVYSLLMRERIRNAYVLGRIHYEV